MHPLVYFYPSGHAAHARPGHPERPERVERIRSALQEAGWWQPYPALTALELDDRVLPAVHSRQHLSALARLAAIGGDVDAETFVNPESWDLALQAAGGAASVAAAVWLGAARRGFALSRPPGHHATRSRAMGFCLLNNAALAAQHLLMNENARRLAILDFDLHHGNGTQDIFYERGEVLYVSTHEFPLYPMTGLIEETGAGPGAMTTLNVPLPAMSGDQAFRAVIEQVVRPVLDRFGPEMILVSAGFDAHWRDPLGHLLISGETYRYLIGQVCAWADAHCGGKVALVLEGGYDLQGVETCALAAVSALLDEPYTDRIGPAPWPEGADWQKILRQVQKVWGL